MSEQNFEKAVVKVEIFKHDENSLSIDLNNGIVLGIIGDNIKEISVAKTTENYCQLTTGLLSAVISREDAEKLKELGATIKHGSL